MILKNHCDTRMDCGDSSYLSQRSVENNFAAHTNSVDHQKRAGRILMAMQVLERGEDYDESIPFKNSKKQYYRSSKFKALQSYEPGCQQLRQRPQAHGAQEPNQQKHKRSGRINRDSHQESQDSELLNMVQLENKFTLEGNKNESTK